MAGAAGEDRPRTWLRRIGWLLLIWAVSVAALGLVAWLLKGVMRAVGLAG